MGGTGVPDQIRVYQGDLIKTFPLKPTEGITFSDDHPENSVPKGNCKGNSIRFLYQKGAWVVICKGTVRRRGAVIDTAEVQDGDLFVLNEESLFAVQFFREKSGEIVNVSLEAVPELLIGRGANCSLQLLDKRVSGSHARIYLDQKKWHICDLNSTNGTYVNGKRIHERILQENDSIVIGSYELIFTSGNLVISGRDPGTIISRFSSVQKQPIPVRIEYPNFSRSPRLIPERPTGKMEIEAAPSVGSKPEINWLSVLLPIIGTLTVSLLMTLFTGGIGMMLSAPMMLIGVAVTVVNYRSQSQKFEQNEAALRKKYQQYIGSCEEKLKEASCRQRDAAVDANPSPERCLQMAEQVDRRLWERTALDDDFLSLRAGLGKEALNIEIQTPKVGFVLQENDFTRMPHKLADRYRQVENIPVLCDMQHNPSLGIVGTRSGILQAARAMLMQAAAHHGYDELKLAVIYPPDERKEWEWVRWLPHIWEEKRRNIASTRYEAGQILSGLEKEFQRRSTEQNGSFGRTAPKLPHYLFLVADASLLNGQPSADYLLKNDPGLGISCILLGHELQDLPGSVQQILEVRGDDGTLYHRERPGEKKVFRVDPVSVSDCDAFARALAPVRLPQKRKADQIPDSVTFLDGYRVQRPDELDIRDYWSNSCSYRSLSVPIGIKAGGGIYSFDIHEKHSGPHGLVAGTNGSGKSEMAQSWIASMAVQFSPRDVNFVLVDFKGTSLLQPFRDLPHLAGSISNLDKDIQRCLMALDNEIERRQMLVDRYSAHDILGYQAMRRMHPDMEEMPFLILVIDEFADFKAQYPDFTGPLNHIFRGGRALGIYTVIMTQKPGGVVTEQMTANANFRWCLKVMSESDSREMLGVSDAAYLNKPGRSYVKIGTGVPELVQPFYSGAPYYPNGAPKKGAMVARVGLTGEKQPVGQNQEQKVSRSKGSQLEAVVKWITDYCHRNGIAPARQIWNEPLPEKLDIARLLPALDLWKGMGSWPEGPQAPVASIGLVDDPANQSQHVLHHSFWQNGNLLVYGMPLSGKTTLLQTMLVSLCSQYTPAQVQCYLVEFGGFSLRGMEQFPHVGGVSGNDDVAQIGKVLDLFLEELEQRKRLFRQVGVGTISAFSEAEGQSLASWLLVIDNLNLAGDSFPESLDKLEQISREGEAFGLYVAATITGTSGVSYRLTQNFKTVLTLQLTDRLDYNQLVGRVMGNIPKPVIGRGLVKGPLEFQTGIVWPELSDGKRAARLREMAKEMGKAWNGPLPRKILSMPENLPYGSVPGKPFVLGLSRKDIAPVCLPIGEITSLLISGGSQTVLEQLVWLLLKQATAVGGISVLICSPALSCPGAQVVRDPEELGAALDALVPELRARQAAHRENPSAKFSPILILLDGLSSVIETAGLDTVSRLEAFIRLGEGLGLTVIGADIAQNVERSYFTQNILMETLHEGAMLLAGGSAGDHRIVDTIALGREFPGAFGDDLLILEQNGNFVGIKKMSCEE